MDPKFITSESQVTIERTYILPRKPTPGVQGSVARDVVLIGECVRGPGDLPVEITSPGRFLEVFGGRDYGSGGTLIGKVWQAIVGKTWGRLWVVRAVDDAATTATVNLTAAGPTTIAKADASSPGKWADGLVNVVVSNASDGNALHWKAVATYLGKSQTWDNLNTQAGSDNLLATQGDDPSNFVKLTKIADGRPLNGTYAVVTSSDGSIADTDFTATGRALDAGFGKRKSVCAYMVCGRSNSVIKAALLTKAAGISGGFVLMTSDAATTADATAQTEAAANASDRVIYCHNYPSKVLDPETGTFMAVEPTSFMASILSQTDPEAHPGDVDSVQYTSAIKALTKSPDETTLDSWRTSGMAGLVEDGGTFVFQSGVTTSGAQITDVRAADYLNSAIGQSLVPDVKKPNTITRRRQQVARIVDFLDDQKRAQHLVDDFYVDGEALDTTLSRGQNKRAILCRVRLISHMNILILQTEMGTQVVLDKSSAT